MFLVFLNSNPTRLSVALGVADFACWPSPSQARLKTGFRASAYSLGAAAARSAAGKVK